MTLLTYQTEQLVSRLAGVADSIQVDYCPLCEVAILIVSYINNNSQTVEFYIDGQTQIAYQYTTELTEQPLELTKQFKESMGIVLGAHLDHECSDNSAIHFRKHTANFDADTY